MFEFNRGRWLAFAAILALIYFVAFFGVWGAIFIPLLGGPLFIAGLMLWYIPGIVFDWTGYFKFHEFGAAPTGWEGHLIMLFFYACVAILLSWPFGLKERRNRSAKRRDSS